MAITMKGQGDRRAELGQEEGKFKRSQRGQIDHHYLPTAFAPEG